MKSIIAGTAGHIDHGKTALVRALTGIDTDRLEEEKRRGISIDLGFAHLDLAPGLRVGFVDVPGHERFVKNMLAGVGGIDLVLLVIAADESVKPQTREHFDICRLLGIRRGIVVLTKVDLVDKDVLDLARMEAEEFVEGSFLQGAPVVAVSSATGEGLDELRKRLAEIAEAIPARDSSLHFRLPVDRSFSIRGFGTVVTGTLVAGSVAREQEVEAYPQGLRLRVRGIQTHGAQEERAYAGQRTALNLAGAEPSDLPRGTVLAEPGRFRAVTRFDCILELLPSAKPLKHRAPVHFHAGTAEIEAEARLLDGMTALRPGARGYAQVVLREPTLLLPGDRFIIRMFSPVVTIGGGTALDISGRRYRAGENAADRLRVFAEDGWPARIALLVREAAFGLPVSDLVALTGLREDKIREAARTAGLVCPAPAQPWLASPEWLGEASERITNALREFHARNPLLAGMPKEDLRGQVLPGSPSFLLDALLSRIPEAAAEGENVRLATHRPSLKEEEERALRALETVFERAGLAAPSLGETLAKSGVDPARARTLLQMLLRQKRLVRIAEDLVVHDLALRDLRLRLAERKGQRFRVPEFKEWTGVSRKYAIPLLEYLDRERVTRREGDERVVL